MKKIVIAFAILSLTACANLNTQSVKNYTVATATAAYSLKEMNESYSNVKSILQSNSNLYTNDEYSALQHTSKKLESLHNIVKSMVKDAGSISDLLINARKTENLYHQAEKAYITARVVIQNHYDDLTETQKIKLHKFDKQAASFSKSIDIILSKPDGTDISKHISTALQVAAGVARIAATL